LVNLGGQNCSSAQILMWIDLRDLGEVVEKANN